VLWRLGIQNLYAVQTVSSTRCADALNRYRPVEHGPLRVLIQLNTSGEQTKGGIDVPTTTRAMTSIILSSGGAGAAAGATEGEGGAGGAAEEDKLTLLATHIVRSCPRLRLVGLMTIGKPDGGSEDFVALREARDRLVRVLPPPPPPPPLGDGDDDDDEGGGGGGIWGESEGEGEGEDGGLGQMHSRGGRRRRLLLSMGMSHDFEMALRAGADVVRVGTGIFGARPLKKGLGVVADAELP
jgi:uncharacterized pyridoxal phosphate-containing UPF0001 family protein